MTNTRADIYQTVTDTIIEAIENGISGKIEMPWHQINRIPENAKTGNSYQGINIPLLWVYQIKKNYALSYPHNNRLIFVVLIKIIFERIY